MQSLADPASDLLVTLTPERQAAALDLINYMLVEGTKAEDADTVLCGMCDRIRGAGLPLERASSIVPLLHAEAAASARFWEHGSGARSYAFPYVASGTEYDRSPAAVVHSTGEWLILWLPDTPEDAYSIVPELKQDGYTHYVMMPVFMRSGMANTFSFATRAAEGFTDADFAFFRAIFPAIAATQEILATHRMLSEAIRMYVGTEPGEHILKGDVHRGEVMRTQAAILFADMRGFTQLTSDMEAEAATALLNAYYDCVVPHVEAAGGEVLKFIGDGILAVFRDTGDAAETCARALEAARAALEAVDAYEGAPRFSVGIGLHYGEAAYGNVGSGARLDYTVIGRDVNLAARVAGLCGALEAPLILSEAFQALTGGTGRSLGPQRLKGLSGMPEVFVA
ncbi:MAG: adenylate/guanylate cyclase domain-containing protein [Paracoccaceae bacterium]